MAKHGVADGNGDARPVLVRRRPAGEAVGGLEADAAHPALADLLGDLCCDEDLGTVDDEADLDGGVDLRQRVRRELDVDDRAGDGDDAAVLEAHLRCGIGGNGGHGVSSVGMGMSRAPDGRRRRI